MTPGEMRRAELRCNPPVVVDDDGQALGFLVDGEFRPFRHDGPVAPDGGPRSAFASPWVLGGMVLGLVPLGLLAWAVGWL